MPDESHAASEQIPDADTQKILDEIEQEEKDKGVKPESETPTPPADDPKATKPEEKPADDGDEDKNKTALQKLAEQTPTTSEDDSDDDDDDDSERQTHTVPLKKHQIKLKKKDEQIAELQKQLALAQTDASKTDAEIRAEMEELADTMGVGQEVVDKLLNLASKSFEKRFGPQLQEASVVSQKQREALENQGFEREFSSLEERIIQEHGEKADKALIKKALYNLAFTEQYAKVPLEVIYNGLSAFRPSPKPAGRATAESGKSGGRVITKATDFANVTDEDVKAMDTETFLKYGKWLEQSTRK